MNRVLIFAYYYPPRIASGAARPARFSRYLPQHGWETVVISQSEDGSVNVSGDLPQNWTQPATSFFTSQKARFYSLMQRVIKENAKLDWAVQAVAAAIPLIESGWCTTVLSTSPPLGTHFAAWQIKRRYPQVRWIADFRDPLADNPFRKKKYDAWIENKIFTQADLMIANTDAVGELWSKKYPSMSDRIKVLWNGFDPADRFTLAPPPQRKARLLVHTGEIYGRRHPKQLCDGLLRLKNRGQLPEDVNVKLVGPIDPTSSIWKHPSFNELHKDGVLLYDNKQVPKKEAVAEAANADYLLLLDVSSTDGGLQVPAKIFDYALCGRPILAATSRNSPVERILQRSNIPHVCMYPADTDEVIEDKILAFFRLETGCFDPSTWFLDQFDADRQAVFLASLL